MPKKFYVSWDNLQREARRLARRQLPVSQWKGIIAVSRGGLVPAALMARELGIRNVETLCISSYDHNSQRELVVVKAATTAGDGEGWLVVEDLVDTGTTAKAIRELYPKAKFIAIFAKPMGEALLDDFEVAIPQDTWIEQPWDMALEFHHADLRRTVTGSEFDVHCVNWPHAAIMVSQGSNLEPCFFMYQQGSGWLSDGKSG